MKDILKTKADAISVLDEIERSLHNDVSHAVDFYMKHWVETKEGEARVCGR